MISAFTEMVKPRPPRPSTEDVPEGDEPPLQHIPQDRRPCPVEARGQGPQRGGRLCVKARVVPGAIARLAWQGIPRWVHRSPVSLLTAHPLQIRRLRPIW